MSDLFTSLWVRVSNTLYREEGQAVTEYAIVIALVATIAGAAAFTGVGATIVAKVSKMLAKI